MLFYTSILCCLLSISVGSPATETKRNARIFGGSKIDIKQAPWTVSIHETNSGPVSLVCAGSIITHKLVATSYYCRTGNESNIFVRVGSTNHDSGGQAIALQEYLFDDDVKPNFILLLLLKDSIIFGPLTYPVALPFSTDVVPYGANCEITGWGILEPEISQPSDSLRVLKTSIWTWQDCKDYRNNANVENEVFFCAGGLGELNTCDYDGGDPLVVDGVLVGITLYPLGCQTTFTSYYLSVPSQVHWIQSVISNQIGA